MADVLGRMNFVSFVGQRIYGWSETHYILGQPNLPAALRRLVPLATARQQLLGAGVVLTDLFVSDPLVNRDSQVQEMPLPGFAIRQNAVTVSTSIYIVSGGTSGSPSMSGPDMSARIYNPSMTGEIVSTSEIEGLRCDFPYSSFGVRLETGSPYQSRRNLALRGNPDIVQDTITDAPTVGPWTVALLGYMLQLVDGRSFGMRVNDPNIVSYSVRSVSWVQTDSLWIPTLHFATAEGAPADWTPGQQVRLRGIRLSTAAGDKIILSGLYRVLANVGGAVQFMAMAMGTEYGIVIQGGSGRRVGQLVLPYVNWRGRTWQFKGTGRPASPARARPRKRRGQPAIVIDP
jgi:hypothetical protein